MNNFENNKENQWNNIEKKNTNWFREKRESIKNFLEWKKYAEEITVKRKTGQETENLKDFAIDSTLDNLQLNMQEWLELSNADNETKEELNHIFEEWKENKKEIMQDEELPKKLEKYNKKFPGRSPEVVQKIVNSATEIETEIKNWQTEKNPVAKSLLKIVNWIMGTEK